jgi:hypothetical protein
MNDESEIDRRKYLKRKRPKDIEEKDGGSDRL